MVFLRSDQEKLKNFTNHKEILSAQQLITIFVYDVYQHVPVCVCSCVRLGVCMRVLLCMWMRRFECVCLCFVCACVCGHMLTFEVIRLVKNFV